MGILNIFNKVSDSLIFVFIKIMVALLAIVAIVMFIQGIAMYWPFVLGTIIGLVFSPFVYKEIESKLYGALPEFCHFSLTEVGEALFMDDERMKQYRQELKEKEDGAKQELNNMKQQFLDINNTYGEVKNKLRTEMYQEARGKRYSSRVRRGLQAQMGQEKLAKHIRKKDHSVDWEQYL